MLMPEYETPNNGQVPLKIEGMIRKVNKFEKGIK
jgi:hypothetical protein